MSICSGCGAECTRFRVMFDKHGNVNGGECPSCKPGSFDPRWLQEKGAMAWEAYPEKYDKIELEDGRVGYRAKEEWQQDTLDKMRAGYERVDHEHDATPDQLAIKRKHRRTRPMTEEEIAVLRQRKVNAATSLLVQ